VSPFSHFDGGDRFRLGDEIWPRLARGVDDVVVGFEDAVREPIGAQILPDVLDRIQLRGARRQEDRRNVFGDAELSRRMPSGAIKQQDGVRALCHVARDFIEMKLHGGGVGEGQGERRALAARRADRAEEIGVFVALIGRLAWPRAALGPLPNKAVLLADASFILKPDFDRSAFRDIGEMGAQRLREVFL